MPNFHVNPDIKDFESKLSKWYPDYVLVIFFKNEEKITSGGLIMYLGEFDFSANVYVVKFTSTKSGYHLEIFDSKFFISGFTWTFGNFLKMCSFGNAVIGEPISNEPRKLPNFHVNPDIKYL